MDTKKQTRITWSLWSFQLWHCSYLLTICHTEEAWKTVREKDRCSVEKRCTTPKLSDANEREMSEKNRAHWKTILLKVTLWFSGLCCHLIDIRLRVGFPLLRQCAAKFIPLYTVVQEGRKEFHPLKYQTTQSSMVAQWLVLPPLIPDICNKVVVCCSTGR